MRQLRLWIGNDMSLELIGLREGQASKDSAIVTVTIKDRSGIEVGGATWPITMTPMGGGDYLAVLPASLEVKRRESYEVTIDVDASGSIGRWCRSVVADCRG